MESNENIYKTECERLTKELVNLRKTIRELRLNSAIKKKLLEECWERIYYKRAWLTLSDENIKGLRKHITEMKHNGRYEKLMLEE